MARVKSGPQNLYGMIEKVLIASMSKGQAPLFVVAGLVAMMIWKMPGEDVSKLVFGLVEALERGYFVGYVISVVTTAGWFLHAKYQRKAITSEMQRIADERNRLQDRQTVHVIESSDQ